MQGSKLVLAVIALGIGVQVLIAGFVFTSKPDGRTSATSKTGFVKVAPPDGVVANEVLVYGLNCNTPDGIRTQALARGLAKLNIPYRQTNSLSYSADNGLGNLWQMNSLTHGDLPIAFINGKAKANPTIDEVVTEYKLAAKL